ncbi:hypothetical protein C9413_32395 [Rhizobium sp. SEMIA 4085]|uniref:hypothetical protein n=1 Tax=Rhizobium TaxID=379 RepID=UPI000A8E3CA5|nr:MULTISPECIES: hypothetical protein [Rhizobium]NNH33891.1 hypothetical protein [Rhizobium sp. SEMIA 4085]
MAKQAQFGFPGVENKTFPAMEQWPHDYGRCFLQSLRAFYKDQDYFEANLGLLKNSGDGGLG